MKVALVHELLTMKGGAERVLRIFADMFPDAPIYTLLYDEKKLGDWFPKERVRTSTIHPAPFLPTPYSHHWYLKKFPAAVEAWDFSEFDLVLSASSAFVHGIITNGKPKHLCYVHSPARYLWDRTHDIIERSGTGLFGPLKKKYLEATFHTLRQWDTEVAPRPDQLIAASKEIQRRIQLYWDRESTVIYPPISDSWFQSNLENKKPRAESQSGMEHSDYFLIVSTLADYKRIDIAIDACNRLKLPLKIVGDGAVRPTLQKLAGPTVAFYGWREGDELADLMTYAKALIIPGAEDFGLVALEAMACGTPVIGHGKGGITETVIDGVTGAYFDAETPESLMQILSTFDPKKYSSQKCHEQAAKFRESVFVQKMHATINALMKDGH